MCTSVHWMTVCVGALHIVPVNFNSFTTHISLFDLVPISLEFSLRRVSHNYLMNCNRTSGIATESRSGPANGLYIRQRYDARNVTYLTNRRIRR